MNDSDKTLADQLREIADVLDKAHIQPVGPDVSIVQAVKTLAKVMKKGSLVIEIDWQDWGKKPPEVEYKIRKDYSTIAEAKSLSECINKATVKVQPEDTLDKLAEMMPVEAKA